MTYHLRGPLLQKLSALILLQFIFAGYSLAKTEGSPADSVDGAEYRTIEWVELMPEDDLNALLNPPEYLNDIADGSPEDQIASQVQNAIAQAEDSDYQRALVSTQIVPGFDGQKIRIPGFIVPLEFGETQNVTRFFLVPYFGACIHVPPPPPNQIIYAEYEKGFTLEALYDPFWLEGTVNTQLIENDMATAAYQLKVDRIEPYTEE